MTLRAWPRVLNTAVAAASHGRVGPCEHDEARPSASTGSTNNGKHSRLSREEFVALAGGDGISGVVIVTAGAAAAIETHTVASFWRGLWWSISLITTVGFIGEPPRTAIGAALSMVLMVLGFLLLAMVSASLASLFVREQDAPFEAREAWTDERILERLAQIDERLRS